MVHTCCIGNWDFSNAKIHLLALFYAICTPKIVHLSNIHLTVFWSNPMVTWWSMVTWWWFNSNKESLKLKVQRLLILVAYNVYDYLWYWIVKYTIYSIVSDRDMLLVFPWVLLHTYVRTLLCWWPSRENNLTTLDLFDSYWSTFAFHFTLLNNLEVLIYCKDKLYQHWTYVLQCLCLQNVD